MSAVSETPDPTATLMVFIIFGCMGFTAVNLGAPLTWVLTAMVFIMTCAMFVMMVRVVLWGRR